MRFFSNPHKPMILALARPDPKKNITTLLKAFGECAPLRELANLVFPPSQKKMEEKTLSLSLSLSSITSLLTQNQ
jgi:sucrose-phosphate synthase